MAVELATELLGIVGAALGIGLAAALFIGLS